MINELNSNKEDFIFFYKFIKTNKNFNDLWRMKSITRDCIKEWLISANIEFTLSENCANACSELIENCIKYSKIDNISYINIKIAKSSIIIETFNYCEETDKNKLKSVIDKIVSITKEQLSELYIQKIKESLQTNSSELGLIKIKMETDAIIQVIENNDKNLAIIKLQINI